jgi:hypothetical protein
MLAIHSTVTFAKYVYPREVADIRYVCGEKYQLKGTLSDICMPEEYRALEVQGRVQMQACVELTCSVVDSVDEVEYDVPLTLACNKHRLISS